MSLARSPHKQEKNHKEKITKKRKKLVVLSGFHGGRGGWNGLVQLVSIICVEKRRPWDDGRYMDYTSGLATHHPTRTWNLDPTTHIFRFYKPRTESYERKEEKEK
jgi:hypothetical protein